MPTLEPHRCQNLCGGGGARVRVHVCTCISPSLVHRKLFSLQKTEANLEDVSHELELTGPILFSPPPPTMLHDAWTYFTHPTWNGVLARNVLGDIQQFCTGNMTSGSMVFLFCIPFKLTVLEDFCRLICISSSPKCFGIPY